MIRKLITRKISLGAQLVNNFVRFYHPHTAESQIKVLYFIVIIKFKINIKNNLRWFKMIFIFVN